MALWYVPEYLLHYCKEPFTQNDIFSISSLVEALWLPENTVLQGFYLCTMNAKIVWANNL